jgi:hypothetical protein
VRNTRDFGAKALISCLKAAILPRFAAPRSPQGSEFRPVFSKLSVFGVVEMHIRKGDVVEVVSGDDSGTRGTVMSVDRKNGKVVIEGVNKVYKHVKRGHPKSPQGGYCGKM